MTALQINVYLGTDKEATPPTSVAESLMTKEVMFEGSVGITIVDIPNGPKLRIEVRISHDRIANADANNEDIALRGDATGMQPDYQNQSSTEDDEDSIAGNADSESEQAEATAGVRYSDTNFLADVSRDVEVLMPMLGYMANNGLTRNPHYTQNEVFGVGTWVTTPIQDDSGLRSNGEDRDPVSLILTTEHYEGCTDGCASDELIQEVQFIANKTHMDSQMILESNRDSAM